MGKILLIIILSLFVLAGCAPLTPEQAAMWQWQMNNLNSAIQYQNAVNQAYNQEFQYNYQQQQIQQLQQPQHKLNKQIKYK